MACIPFSQSKKQPIPCNSKEEYLEKEKKLYMCFADLEKAFDRVARKVVEWAMRKKGVPEVMVRAVMSLYEGTKNNS
mgnify:CR=1 FL=1